MATVKKAIKKACKGVSYPKSSSVSSRLGSPAKLKGGGKVPKTAAQKKFAALAAPKDKITFADKIAGAKGKAKKGMKVKKAQAGSSVNPKFKMDMEKFKMQRGVDSVKIPYTKDSSGKSNPKKVDDLALRKSMKKGGKMTKKCAYGCK